MMTSANQACLALDFQSVAVETMTYAGVGSRSTPSDQLNRIRLAAQRLRGMGYTLLSGGASGADTSFEAGAGAEKQIFLPWARFNGNESQFTKPSREAEQIAATVHPSWRGLSGVTKLLMGRNSHQVLGADLMHPVDFLVCWTPDGCESEDDRSIATGGTGQAIALASRNNIPVFNLARHGSGERLRDFLANKGHDSP